MAAVGVAPGFGQAPAVMAPSGSRPVVIASANGHRYKNGGPRTAVEEAFDAHDAGRGRARRPDRGREHRASSTPPTTAWATAACPTRDGVVQLDASLHARPAKRAGGGGRLEGVRTPSLVARRWPDLTDHHLLVGQRRPGVRAAAWASRSRTTSTPRTRASSGWSGSAASTPSTTSTPRSASGGRARGHARQMMAEGLIDPRHDYGTINCNGVNAKGEVCGVTTTSGLAWKIPGRVGDSPDPRRRALRGRRGGRRGLHRPRARRTSTTCPRTSSWRRCGAAARPRTRAWRRCSRIRANTVEKRLLERQGRPATST